MADTARGDWPDAKCSDCKENGCFFQHWGPLVPPGETGQFCGDCWEARVDDYLSGRPVRPLGQKASHKAKKIPNRVTTVTTRNSVYRFGKANDKGKRTVSCDNKSFDSTLCKIVFLVIGKDMELECFDGSHTKWYTSLVRSIK